MEATDKIDHLAATRSFYVARFLTGGDKHELNLAKRTKCNERKAHKTRKTETDSCGMGRLVNNKLNG